MAAYQLSLFPTEEEQIAYIAEAESYTPSAFSMSIPQDDIDHILRLEGNADHARMEIVTEFSKGKSVEEIALFLQKPFHGGNGVVTENGRYSVCLQPLRIGRQKCLFVPLHQPEGADADRLDGTFGARRCGRRTAVRR